VFGAVAELIDNARDAGLSNVENGTLLWIDEKRAEHKHCLVLTDNGCGMNEKELHNMMSLGYTGTEEETDTEADTQYRDTDESCGSYNTEDMDIEHTRKGRRIGHFGFGFKSGSMRIGDDAIVLTMTDATCSIGMYSTRFLKLIKATEVLLPIISFDKTDMSHNITDHAEQSLELIIKYSIIFKSFYDIIAEFDNLKKQLDGKTGTRIIIYNLKNPDNTLELDFKHNAKDIVISGSNFNAPVLSPPEMDYRRSLREYCSILYSSSAVKIILRGKEVEVKDFQNILTNQSVLKHRNKPTGISTEFIFGMTDQEDYGLMLYHNDRLIKAYEKVGCQTKMDEGKGVIALVDLADIVEPMHNKQEFNTIGIHFLAYNTMIRAFTDQLNKYCRRNVRKEAPVVEQRTPRFLKRKRSALETPSSTPSKQICRISFMQDAAFPTKSHALIHEMEVLTKLLPALSEEHVYSKKSSTSCSISSGGLLDGEETACIRDMNTSGHKSTITNITDDKQEIESFVSKMSGGNVPDISEANVSDISETDGSDISEANDRSITMNDETITVTSDDDDYNNTSYINNNADNGGIIVINDDDQTLSSIRLKNVESDVKQEVNVKEEHNLGTSSGGEHNSSRLNMSSNDHRRDSNVNVIEHLNKELVRRSDELRNIRTNVLKLMSLTHSQFVKDVHASNLADIDEAFEQKISDIANSSPQN